ncbi:MAG TPA: CxxC-x17-CxxC domain-containing protein [Candidatus Nanoarchaeia archaeon]|nr:CxxC-x17-CxxC domain-containing protein [Candidatus Nanoarchaeia archaeon]
MPGFDRPRNMGPRETHKAVCSKCNNECEVPFKPQEGRPVYCKDCYKKRE